MVRINKKIILIVLGSAFGGIALFTGIVALVNQFYTQETNITKISGFLSLQKSNGYKDYEIELLKRVSECSKQYGELTGEGYYINIINLNECTKLPKSFTGINVTINKNDHLFVQIMETEKEHYISIFEPKTNNVIASISLEFGKAKQISYDVYDDSGELAKSIIDKNWDGQANLKLNYIENGYSQKFIDGTWRNVGKIKTK